MCYEGIYGYKWVYMPSIHYSMYVSLNSISFDLPLLSGSAHPGGITGKGPLSPKSLSYQKEGWTSYTRPSFFWYDNDPGPFRMTPPSYVLHPPCIFLCFDCIYKLSHFLHCIWISHIIFTPLVQFWPLPRMPLFVFLPFCKCVSVPIWFLCTFKGKSEWVVHRNSLNFANLSSHKDFIVFLYA